MVMSGNRRAKMDAIGSELKRAGVGRGTAKNWLAKKQAGGMGLGQANKLGMGKLAARDMGVASPVGAPMVASPVGDAMPPMGGKSPSVGGGMGAAPNIGSNPIGSNPVGGGMGAAPPPVVGPTQISGPVTPSGMGYVGKLGNYKNTGVSQNWQDVTRGYTK